MGGPVVVEDRLLPPGWLLQVDVEPNRVCVEAFCGSGRPEARERVGAVVNSVSMVGYCHLAVCGDAWEAERARRASKTKR